MPTVIKVPAGAEADIATRVSWRTWDVNKEKELTICPPLQVAGAPKIVEAEILEGSVLKAFLKG